MTDQLASERLAALGLELPAVAKPLAAYVPALAVGNQVWTSGQLPVREGKLIASGKLGGEVTPEQGVACAQQCALNAIAAAASIAGGIDKIKRIVKLVVFVASDPSFTAQPAVANGASELMGAVFGEAGAHVRSAFGVAVLPLDAPVELELIVEV
ncbi:RidA family protein [Propioniciclava tarda]|uniref:RidA family protein n=1 Tax=Propioniciclava tarda TaxID=433330 RepID=A0A4V6MV38_PROTD|nr:RidA family protein [Propioniciclava tarda]TBT92121.1 RidA family protein [Propioniciclava tarda]SMO83953.1 Enamine deaminase RidA, house cleaning of reactive enamine intermediates, YjgF/YER057c/UK114 family [Propioniciclava tarda]HOA88629.1 RidA family protein [Propioniciclava tarda]HQA30959.1 RidA family protein [Propioniciclava tarda]HQD60422.1 RidA family protein [Propioniciclava tarda]